jgi:hypothetical protein
VREHPAGRRTMFAHFELATQFRFGQGCAGPNLEKCVEHYRLSAELGYHRAYVSLGMRYQFGQGVPQDDVEGARLMKIAAIMGNTDGMHNLAGCYSHGSGVESNLDEAMRWWRAAAQVGPSSAHWDLGRHLYTGELPCARHVSLHFRGMMVESKPRPRFCLCMMCYYVTILACYCVPVSLCYRFTMSPGVAGLHQAKCRRGADLWGLPTNWTHLL